jgi:predicted O-linked N-acetylglucosamine transferase (SPINDLY family)
MTLQQAFGLAHEHQAAGRLAEAESLCRQILAIQPRSAEVMQMLGILACVQGRRGEGIGWLEQAVAVDPSTSAYHANLGLALATDGQIDRAISTYERALHLRPGPAPVYNNLGNALRAAGRMDEALAVYRHAASITSDSLDVSNLLWFLHFHPSSTPKQILDEHVRWDQRFARPLLTRAFFANDRSPERRLRIGYVSPDLREHPVGRFFAPVLDHHDRSAF